MKRFSAANLYAVMLLAVTTCVIIWAYPRLPDRVPIHWGLSGEPDGYGNKWPYAFLGPTLGVGLIGLFAVLPLLDPKKRNYQRFERPYRMLRDAIVTFGCFIGILPVITTLGLTKSSGTLIMAGVGILFAFMGNYMSQLKQNWYAGIKTPWTLSNEIVWNKTHRFSGKLWFIGGLLTSALAFLPKPVGPISSAIVISTVGIIPIVYSYIVYREEMQKK